MKSDYEEIDALEQAYMQELSISSSKSLILIVEEDPSQKLAEPK